MIEVNCKKKDKTNHKLLEFMDEERSKKGNSQDKNYDKDNSDTILRKNNLRPIPLPNTSSYKSI